MGYIHGKGLGKEKQGIVEPLKPVARPGRGALGIFFTIILFFGIIMQNTLGAYGHEAQGPKFGGMQ